MTRKALEERERQRGENESPNRALSLSQFMAQFHEKIYQLLKNLLQLSPETKHRILSWLGNCLHANAGRTKIWANQMPEIFFQMYASDAFFLNLGAALLRLCQPFCKPKSPKLLSFNPTYCALKELNEEERRSKNVHMRGAPRARGVGQQARGLLTAPAVRAVRESHGKGWRGKSHTNKLKCCPAPPAVPLCLLLGLLHPLPASLTQSRFSFQVWKRKRA